MGQEAAARLLMQGTFGATSAEITAVASQSYTQWFALQAKAPPSLLLPTAMTLADNADWSPNWFKNVVNGPDQLRQRMAFALSEIFVVSHNGGPLTFNSGQTLAYYYDILTNNALGNFRTLLERVTLSPTMGQFLNMWRNAAANPLLGTHADQNYAREIMQLFTVGLVKLNIDGSVQTDSSGNPIATYSQADVANLANVFTGWASQSVSHVGDAAWEYDNDNTAPMTAYQNYHDTTQKTIIGGVTVPAGGTAQSDLDLALDTLFNSPNVGPFISKQLIERLVTSNPSPAYIQRVAEVFNNDGTGIRGNLLAVATAILTDPEATAAGGNQYGKLREPLLRLTSLWRAFDAYDGSGGLSEYPIIATGMASFGEYPLDSPSVFNFFRPDFQMPGALAADGLVSPEFQITNENSLVLTANSLQAQAYQYVDGAGTAYAGTNSNATAALTATSVMLHTAGWESLAANPAALVDQLNLVLMAGQMPDSMQATLIAYASAIPEGNLGTRVAETSELLINSAQYAIQR
jgi:uncharacterized protein (DUF1800 family)